MNNLIIYDGTIEGLFSAITHVIDENDIQPRFSAGGEEQPGLFDSPSVHPTDHDKADKLLTSASESMSSLSISNMLHVFLSSESDKERYIFDYLRAGFRYGLSLDNHLTEYPVDIINRVAARVRHEAHRMKGLVRFSSVEDGTLYAPVEPDHDILPLIAGHFKRRMPGERWMIHDLKRGRAALYEKGRVDIVPVTLNRQPAPDEKEEFYSSLWRGFHKRIAIKERSNPRLQKQFMPVRYWKYLTEKQ